jgi:hypothetical protein
MDMSTKEILTEIENIKLEVMTLAKGDARISGLTVALIVLYDEYVKKTKGR